MSKVIRLGLAAVVTATLFGAAPSAFAGSRGAGDVVTSGQCSGASAWKLKLASANGQIEAQFEVDENVVGDTWKVVMKDNGTRFFRGKRTTKAASGSFEVRKFTTDLQGTDNIVAKATNLTTAEVCKGTGSI